MSMPLPPLEPTPPKQVRLAPIAIILVVIIIVAFGVCASNFKLEGTSPPSVTIAIVTEIAAIFGLIGLAVIAITRKKSRRQSR